MFRLTHRPARSPADLQADSATVRYDLDMLVETAGWYVEAERRNDVVGMNIAVESFAIHCRAMIQFLFGHLEWLGSSVYKCISAAPYELGNAKYAGNHWISLLGQPTNGLWYIV